MKFSEQVRAFQLEQWRFRLRVAMFCGREDWARSAAIEIVRLHADELVRYAKEREFINKTTANMERMRAAILGTGQEFAKASESAAAFNDELALMKERMARTVQEVERQKALELRQVERLKEAERRAERVRAAALKPDNTQVAVELAPPSVRSLVAQSMIDEKAVAEAARRVNETIKDAMTRPGALFLRNENEAWVDRTLTRDEKQRPITTRGATIAMETAPGQFTTIAELGGALTERVVDMYGNVIWQGPATMSVSFAKELEEEQPHPKGGRKYAWDEEDD